MGSDRHYPEEAPVRQVTVADFWIDRTPVTNRQFRKFVNETGHVTLAEIAARREGLSRCASRTCSRPARWFSQARRGPVDLRDWSQWWQFKFGANWRRPYGPRSSISGLDDHPVVHIAYRDARSLREMGRQGVADRSRMGICRARRTGRRRIRLGRRIHAGRQTSWPTPGKANFRGENLAIDGYERTSPVTAFPPNGYGLYDMIGNVWEWTADWFTPQHEATRTKPCCAPDNPRGAAEETSYDPRQPEHQDSAQGAQRRLASLRAELLPPLSPGRTPCAAGRHLDEPHRISLCHQNRERDMSDDATGEKSGLKATPSIVATYCSAARRLRPLRHSDTAAHVQLAQAQQPTSSGQPPNILVIMGDDVGWFNIGAYHQGIMSGKTPNLDKLAAEGMRFTDYYAEASCTAGPRQLHHRGNSATHRHDDGRPGGRRRRPPRPGRHDRPPRSSRSATRPDSSARTILAI